MVDLRVKFFKAQDPWKLYHLKYQKTIARKLGQFTYMGKTSKIEYHFGLICKILSTDEGPKQNYIYFRYFSNLWS